MADIALTNIGSGFNVSVINDNFQTIQSTINKTLLHLSGSNNVMRQDLDLNGFNVLNTATDESSGSLVTRQDLADIEGNVSASPVLSDIANREVRGVTGDTSTSLTDAYGYIRTTGASPVNITIEDSGHLIGAEIHIRQQGTGLVTLVAGSGVTVNVPFGGTLVLSGTGATVTVKKAATNEWDLMGQVAGV